MTRINAGIPVETLCDAHLRAEHREITRIPNAVTSGRANTRSIPKQFKLGIGHVSFFYDKMLFLKNRYIQLFNECRRRGFNVQNKSSSFDNIPERLMNDWKPTAKDNKTVQERIDERLESMKNVKYTKPAERGLIEIDKTLK